MRLVKLFLTAISCCLIGASPQNSKAQCFNSQPDDSGAFGTSLAMDGNYLAVGDPGANKVIIFTKDNEGRWYRDREIRNTSGVVPKDIDDDFGENIEIHKNILAVKTVYENPEEQSKKPSFLNKVFNVFKSKNTTKSSSNTFLENIYITDLDKKSKTELIGSYKQVKSNNDRVSITNKEFILNELGVLFIDTYKTKRVLRNFRFKEVHANNIVVLSKNKKNEYIESRIKPPKNSHGFLTIMANDHSLITTSLTSENGNKVWLYDLNDLQKIQTLKTFPDVNFYGRSASNKFLAFQIFPEKASSKYEYGAVLIQDLSNDSRKLIEVNIPHIEVFLDENILIESDVYLIESSPENDSNLFRITYLYELDDGMNKKFLKKETNIAKVLLKNGMLLKVKSLGKPSNFIELCIEKVHS